MIDKLQTYKSLIITFLQRNLFAVIIAIIVFFIFIPIIIFTNTQAPQTNIRQGTPIPSLTAKPTPFTNQKQNSNYIDAGDIDPDTKIEKLPDGSIKQTVPSEISNRSNIVIIKNNEVIFTRYPVIGKDVSDGYKDLLGKQTDSFPGPTFYGPNTAIYFYQTRGTALIVDPKTSTTYEQFTFQPPISVSEFKQKYREYAN